MCAGPKLIAWSLISEFHGDHEKNSKIMEFWEFWKNSKIGYIWVFLHIWRQDDVVVMWHRRHGIPWWQVKGDGCTLAVGGTMESDIGAKCVSGLAENVNHCRMGEKRFRVPSLYHVTSLRLCHIEWGKPLSHANWMLTLVHVWDATCPFSRWSQPSNLG